MAVAFAFVLALVIMIPILAIVFDSPIGQALGRRISDGEGGGKQLASRVETLEAEMRYLTESVESVNEEARFLRSLLEAPEEHGRLGSGASGPKGDDEASSAGGDGSSAGGEARR